MSSSLTRCLLYSFRYPEYNNTHTENTSLQDNVLNRFIKIEKDDKEVPNFLSQHMSKNAIIYLYRGSNYKYVSTSNQALKFMFYDSNYSNKLVTVIFKNGTCYYGSKGIIFDEKYNLLYLVTTVVNDNKRSYNLYLNPIVFSQKTILNKFIVDKLIPYLTSDEAKWSIGDINITIKDVSSRFIKSPEKINPNCYSDKDLNKILIDNIEDIVDF
jgi:hypothetical protein